MNDDYRDIVNIVGLFSHHIDQRDFAALASLFSDMTYRSNGIDYAVSGEADLATFYERVVDEANLRFAGDPKDAKTVRHHHVFTNLVVEIAPGRQTASCNYYGTVYAHSARQPHTARWSGRYHDQFRRIDGRWRIVERLQLTDYPTGYRPDDRVRP
jgi:hypothetical protein